MAPIVAPISTLEEFLNRLENNIKTPFEKVLEERIDPLVLDSLILSSKVSGIERTKLRRIKKGVVDGHHSVKYTYGKGRDIGRLTASAGVQNLMVALGHTLTHEFCRDIDMCNAGPTIFYQLSKTLGLESKELASFVENRAQFLERNEVDKEQALTQIFSKTAFSQSKELCEIHRFLHVDLTKTLMQRFPAIWEIANNKKGNRVGSFLALVYHQLECSILLEASTMAMGHGYKANTLIHDGFTVISETAIPEEFFLELHDHVLKTTGFDIKWVEKEMLPLSPEFLSAPAVNEEQAQKILDKAMTISEGYFDPAFVAAPERKIDNLTSQYMQNFLMADLDSATYMSRSCIDDPFEMFLTRDQVELRFGSNVVSRLRSNGTLTRVNKTIFDPKMPARGHVLPNGTVTYVNRFKGFKAKKLDRHVTDAEVSVWVDHLRDVVCNGVEDEYIWMRNWFVNMAIGNKNTTVPVLFGKQGAGKGVLVTEFGKHVLGQELYHGCDNIERLINGAFNTEIKDKTLILIDEIQSEAGQFHGMWDRFKSWVTAETYELKMKYRDNTTQANQFSLVLCTNNERSVKIEESDRRFYMTEVSDKMVGNGVYFKDYCSWMSKNGDLLYTWLLQHDISDFNLQKMPTTEIKELIQTTYRSPFDSFMDNFEDGFPVSKFDEGTVYEKEIRLDDLMEMYSQYLSRHTKSKTIPVAKTFSNMLHRVGYSTDRRMVNGKRSQFVKKTENPAENLSLSVSTPSEKLFFKPQSPSTPTPAPTDSIGQSIQNPDSEFEKQILELRANHYAKMIAEERTEKEYKEAVRAYDNGETTAFTFSKKNRFFIIHRDEKRKFLGLPPRPSYHSS